MIVVEDLVTRMKRSTIEPLDTHHMYLMHLAHGELASLGLSRYVCAPSNQRAHVNALRHECRRVEGLTANSELASHGRHGIMACRYHRYMKKRLVPLDDVGRYGQPEGVVWISGMFSDIGTSCH